MAFFPGYLFVFEKPSGVRNHFLALDFYNILGRSRRKGR